MWVYYVLAVYGLVGVCVVYVWTRHDKKKQKIKEERQEKLETELLKKTMRENKEKEQSEHKDKETKT